MFEVEGDITLGQRNIEAKGIQGELEAERERIVYLNKWNSKWYGWRRDELAECSGDHMMKDFVGPLSEFLFGLSIMKTPRSTELRNRALWKHKSVWSRCNFLLYVWLPFWRMHCQLSLVKDSNGSIPFTFPLWAEIRNILGQGWGNFRGYQQ